MAFARTILTLVLAVSLAALPARVGAMVVAADAHASTAVMDSTAMDSAEAMPMPDGCDQHQGTKAPGACSTYCSSIPALPTFVLVSADAVLTETIALPADTAIDGLSASPEPHPPKSI